MNSRNGVDDNLCFLNESNESMVAISARVDGSLGVALQIKQHLIKCFDLNTPEHFRLSNLKGLTDWSS